MRRGLDVAWKMLQIIVVTIGGVFWGMALACVVVLLLERVV